MNAGLVANRFRLLAPIGTGNMGEVYRAEDVAAADGEDRVVALKRILRSRSGVIIDSRSDLKAVQRFQREVRIMRRLRHPNLTRIIAGGVDEQDGRPYLAMELLDGELLSDLVAEQPELPIAWVAALGAQIADGLAAAHAAMVVHRDLKPGNVMLLRGGMVKILDFGIGRIIDDTEADGLTSTGVTVGTARYMAPSSSSPPPSPRRPTCTPWAACCSSSPPATRRSAGASAHELGDKHINDEPPKVNMLRSDVPEDIVRLIDRLLAKEPADRPADAVSVREALLPYALGETRRRSPDGRTSTRYVT